MAQSWPWDSQIAVKKKEQYSMIPCTTFVSFFPFSGRSYVAPVVLYNTKKVIHSNTHIESKNQNPKRRMVTKNILYFIFELKNP